MKVLILLCVVVFASGALARSAYTSSSTTTAADNSDSATSTTPEPAAETTTATTHSEPPADTTDPAATSSTTAKPEQSAPGNEDQPASQPSNATESRPVTIADVEAEGRSLPDKLSNYWKKWISELKKDVRAAGAAASKGLSKEGASAVAAALKTLKQVIDQIIGNILTFSKVQNEDTAKLVQDYLKLIDALKGSTNEAPMHEQWIQGQAMTSQWEKNLSNITRDGNDEFEKTMRKEALKAAKEAKDPQAGDKAREAVTNAGVAMKEALVKKGSLAIGKLTGHHFAKVLSFMEHAQTLMTQNLNEAKSPQAKPAEGSSQQPAETTEEKSEGLPQSAESEKSSQSAKSEESSQSAESKKSLESAESEESSDLAKSAESPQSGKSDGLQSAESKKSPE